jgi:hypothetical protein
MRIVTSDIPSIKKYTKNLIEVLAICETGISLPDDCPPIFRARPRILIFVNPELLDYFDLNLMLLKTKPFSFFVGKELLLREIRGYDNVIQLEDDQQNRLELKMKSDIDDIFRRKKLLHVQRRIKAKVKSKAKRALTKKSL